MGKLFPNKGKKVFGFLKKIMPIAATVLTGGAAAPLLLSTGAGVLKNAVKDNPLATAAIDTIGEVVLGKKGASIDEVGAMLESPTPDQLVLLKQADKEFDARMIDAGVDLYALQVEDTGDARDLAKNNMVPHIVLSVAYSLAYFTALYLVLTGKAEIRDDMMGLANTLLSLLTAAQLQILNFWFGSSAGSKEKTAKIASL